MQIAFDKLIDSFVRDKIGIAEDFIPVGLAARLKAKLKQLFADNALHAAGIGNGIVPMQDTAVRGDMIRWLDRSHEVPCENDFLDLMDSFVSYLNLTCYTGITGYEFHYTMYGPGSYYRKHIDQFHNNEGRKYSMVMYLNDDWQPADGGELMIHQNGIRQSISPTGGKSVFFSSSEMEHEVLLTSKPRMSITGWLKVGGD